MIQVQGLTKYYGDLAAVTDLSFAVRAGEVLGLVGPNGAGKTTTLRSIVGVINPTAGSIRIAGHDLSQDPLAAKRAVAFIPDDPKLFDHLTVEEHLRFVGRIYEVADVYSRIDVLLEELELIEKRHVLPDELSRGMKQKLAIACGLIHRPKAILFDEPMTGLDPAGIRRLKSTISDHAANGGAVILSSHLLHLVEELCTSVLVIQNGRQVAAGSLPEVLASRPELEGKGLEEVFLALTRDT